MMITELHLNDFGVEANSSKRSERIQDKVGESIQTITPDGMCLLPGPTKISNCFTYVIDSRVPSLTAKFTMRLRRKLLPTNVSVTLHELSRMKGELRKLGRVTLDQTEIGRIRSLRIEVIRSAKSWFNSGTKNILEHNVKVDVLANNQAVPYFSVFVAPPELDCAYYDNAGQSNCNPKIECCLIPYYVNFTEIGWDKFILYPEGFFANYCIGPKLISCPHDDPFVGGILNTATNSSLSKLYRCVPRRFAPLNILYSVGPSHSIKLRLDDVRALSCSCTT